MRSMLISLVAIYLAVSCFAFFCGAMGANRANGGSIWNTCMDRPTRIEPLFPSYILGCYLFSTSGEPYYYGQEEK